MLDTEIIFRSSLGHYRINYSVVASKYLKNMDARQPFYLMQQAPDLGNTTVFSVGLVIACLLLLILLWLPDLLTKE